MAGHVQSVYQAEERMSVGVEPVGKQLFHRIRAVFERRQRNVVQHDQGNRFSRFPRAEIGRRGMAYALKPAVLPVCSGVIVHDVLPVRRAIWVILSPEF